MPTRLKNCDPMRFSSERRASGLEAGAGGIGVLKLGGAAGAVGGSGAAIGGAAGGVGRTGGRGGGCGGRGGGMGGMGGMGGGANEGSGLGGWVTDSFEGTPCCKRQSSARNADISSRCAPSCASRRARCAASAATRSSASCMAPTLPRPGANGSTKLASLPLPRIE
jgi:hypothetical protein